MRHKTPKDERESNRTFVTIEDFLLDNSKIDAIKAVLADLESDPRYTLWSDFIPIDYFEGEKFRFGMAMQDQVRNWRNEARFLFIEKQKLSMDYAKLLSTHPTHQYLEILTAKKDFLLLYFESFASGIIGYRNIRAVHFGNIEEEIESLPGSYQDCKALINHYTDSADAIGAHRFYRTSIAVNRVFFKHQEEQKLLKKIEKAKTVLSDNILTAEDIIELEKRKIWDTKLKNARAKERQKEMYEIHLQERIAYIAGAQQRADIRRIQIEEQAKRDEERRKEYAKRIEEDRKRHEEFEARIAKQEEETRRIEQERKINSEKFAKEWEEYKRKSDIKRKKKDEEHKRKLLEIRLEGERELKRIKNSENLENKDLHSYEIQNKLNNEGDVGGHILKNLRHQAAGTLELNEYSNSDPLHNNIRGGNMQSTEVELKQKNNGSAHDHSRDVVYETQHDLEIKRELGVKEVKNKNDSLFFHIGIPALITVISSSSIGYGAFCLSKELESVWNPEYNHILISVTAAILGAIVLSALFKCYYDHHHRNHEGVSLVKQDLLP